MFDSPFQSHKNLHKSASTLPPSGVITGVFNGVKPHKLTLPSGDRDSPPRDTTPPYVSSTQSFPQYLPFINSFSYSAKIGKL
ncbi:hypothetical protein J6V86_02020 [bacterium]|nr:hypothetical protein [bacterium]